MTERERFIESFTFGSPDHLMIEHSFGLMPGTLERWHAEGLPQEVDEQGIWGHFGFQPRRPGVPVNTGLWPAFETSEWEEDGVVYRRDAMGTVRRLKPGITTLAIPFEFPVKTAADWPDYKARLQFAPERIGAEFAQRYDEIRRNGWPVTIGAMGFYWFPRDLMGDEELCAGFYEQPKLIHEIMETHCDLLTAVAEEVVARCEVDSLHMGEDMCYRTAMMVSPAIFREFILPRYRRVIEVFRAGGARIFSVDTDGHLGQLIPLLVEAGVNVVLPCEVMAGNDIVAMRRRWGKRMAFRRGINKLALADRPTCLVPGASGAGLSPREAIDQELEYRLPPLVESGGYAAGLDHRVVPETSLDSFTYHVRRTREMLGLGPDAPAFERS